MREPHTHPPPPSDCTLSHVDQQRPCAPQPRRRARIPLSQERRSRGRACTRARSARGTPICLVVPTLVPKGATLPPSSARCTSAPCGDQRSACAASRREASALIYAPVRGASPGFRLPSSVVVTMVVRSCCVWVWCGRRGRRGMVRGESGMGERSALVHLRPRCGALGETRGIATSCCSAMRTSECLSRSSSDSPVKLLADRCSPDTFSALATSLLTTHCFYILCYL